MLYKLYICLIVLLSCCLVVLSFMAPEVFELVSTHGARWAEGYSYAVDYWSLGVLVYIMLTGSYPFPREKCSIEEDIKVRKEGLIEFPDTMSTDCVNFICALLEVVGEERLGYGLHGRDNIKNHPFYVNCSQFDWGDVMGVGCRPPVVPSDLYDFSTATPPRFAAFEDLPLDGLPAREPDLLAQHCFNHW
jgi:serine/threonine protein kinase